MNIHIFHVYNKEILSIQICHLFNTEWQNLFISIVQKQVDLVSFVLIKRLH